MKFLRNKNIRGEIGMNIFEKELELCSLITEDACEKAYTSFFYESKASKPNVLKAKIYKKKEYKPNLYKSAVDNPVKYTSYKVKGSNKEAKQLTVCVTDEHLSLMQTKAVAKITEIINKLREFIETIIMKIRNLVVDPNSQKIKQKVDVEKKRYIERTKKFDTFLNTSIINIQKKVHKAQTAKDKETVYSNRTVLESISSTIEKLKPPSKTGYGNLRYDEEFRKELTDHITKIHKKCDELINWIKRQPGKIKETNDLTDDLADEKIRLYVYATNVVSKLELKIVKCITV